MIQLAWLWLRYQPGSELAEWFRKRVGTLAGRTRRIAIVAVARKLLIAFWRYVETGVVPFKRCPPTLPISQRVAVGAQVGLSARGDPRSFCSRHPSYH